MLSRVYSGTTKGLDGVLIEVEVDVADRGFPTFTIVGLPAKSVDEAKDRVRTAIHNTSFKMPDSRLTVNLAPADIPKEGSALDLPIAVGILASCGFVEKDMLADSLFIGELSLKGSIRSVSGLISIAMMAKEKGLRNLYVPFENVQEALLIDGVTVYAVPALADLILHLNRQMKFAAQRRKPFHISSAAVDYNFSEIKGQQTAKRALQIAAAGFHNVHLNGPPGAGKTMLSRAFVSILPSLSKDEVLEITKIHSVAGLIQQNKLMFVRPFRSPHHTTSRIGLIGGGAHPQPGEISLAHRGVLFLDEFAEFPRHVLESLRQPLEDGVVTISRASGSVSFPCRFLLIAASNPCPCGYLGHPKRTCKCMPGTIMRYRKRLSGPMLDRIDLHVDVPPVHEDQLMQTHTAESSESIRYRIEEALGCQRKRFKDKKIHYNAEMRPADVRTLCKISDEGMLLLKKAVSTLSLSARTYFKIIKIAQTISDLIGKDKIEDRAIAEALQYRPHED